MHWSWFPMRHNDSRKNSSSRRIDDERASGKRLLKQHADERNVADRWTLSIASEQSEARGCQRLLTSKRQSSRTKIWSGCDKQCFTWDHIFFSLKRKRKYFEIIYQEGKKRNSSSNKQIQNGQLQYTRHDGLVVFSDTRRTKHLLINYGSIPGRMHGEWLHRRIGIDPKHVMIKMKNESSSDANLLLQLSESFLDAALAFVEQ